PPFLFSSYLRLWNNSIAQREQIVPAKVTPLFYKTPQKGETRMKGYGKYWKTLKNRSVHWTTRSKHLLTTSLLRSTLALLAVAEVGLASLPLAHAAEPHFGEIETFANVPATPGFPEGISVDGNRVYVSGPATAGTGGTGPSK